MKMSLGKKIVLLIAVLLIIPIYINQNTAVANAATPAFTNKSVVINGVGKTYQLKIKNTVKGSTYKWSSSDRNIATITSKGLVTAMNKGTTTLKCKITYSSKKTQTISCTVTVKIPVVKVPAVGIKINNAVKVGGSHKLLVGESFKFTCLMTPSNTTDMVYWSVGEDSKDCIKVDTLGNVTGLKAGKAILTARAASSESTKSVVTDVVIIDVVNPSSSVLSADIVSSNVIKVVFDSPIDSSTVIGTNNKLLDNISVSLKKNTKDVLASDPGTLTAALSSDLKTLTITSSNMFSGNYGINISSAVKTTGGLSIVEFNKTITYVDTVGPAISSVDLDDSGMIDVIKFTEPINITNIKASNAALVPSGTVTTFDASTLDIINNKLNYVLSSDKQSLTINLSKIAVSDYGKTFSAILSGITDLAGNAPASFTLPIYLHTDNTPKAQAQPLYITRSSYTTLTATFNRAIQTPGIAIVNGTSIVGVVDINDNKKVNYTLDASSVSLRGNQIIAIGYWNGYNVISTDTTAQQQKTFTVDFTVDTTIPVLMSFDYDGSTAILTLTYNKAVNLKSASSIFSTTLKTVTDDIVSGTNINYTKIASTDDKVIKLQLSNITLLGSYIINLEEGFVIDNFNNKSPAKSITISNSNGTSAGLPGPYAVYQSTTNLSQITLEFANKLDVTSAQDISNYKIAGVTIISAVVTKNTSDNGATVILTVADGTIDVSLERPITINGVKGYNGSYSAISSFTKTVMLNENKKPILISTTFDTTTRNRICLTFSEELKGTMTVTVTQVGTSITYTGTITVSGSKVYITLDGAPTNGVYLNINVVSNTLTDLSGNATNMSTSLGVVVTY